MRVLLFLLGAWAGGVVGWFAGHVAKVAVQVDRDVIAPLAAVR